MSKQSSQETEVLEETDGISIFRALTNRQTDLPLPHRTRQSFRSLDRSLKAFLRSSNLPGLEYRLRLTGYNTLSDLLNASEAQLCASGLTPLLARRLLVALDDYIVRQLDRNEGVQIPFQLVRKGQKIKSDPTEKMKAMPTFGMQNVRRRQPLPEAAKMGRKRASKGSGTVSKGGGKVAASSQRRPVSFVRLMSEENLPTEPIFPNVLPEVTVEQTSTGEEAGVLLTLPEGVVTPTTTPTPPPEDAVVTTPTSTPTPPPDEMPAESVSAEETSATPPSERAANLAPSAAAARSVYRHSMPIFQEFYLPEEVDTQGNLEGKRLRRCSSVPADFRFLDAVFAAPTGTWCHVRSYSCPPSLAAVPTQIESTIFKLSTSQDIHVVLSCLRLLCAMVKSAEGTARKEVRAGGGLEAVMDVLASLCTNTRAVEYCFTIIKYLTREGLFLE